MTTEAGKRLLGELGESPLPGARYARDVVVRRIDAIEAEAVAARNAEIAAAVRELAKGPNPSRSRLLDPAAVLAIIEKP